MLQKPVNIIIDYAANIKRAMMKLMTNVKWWPCFAHTLQLVVNNGLDYKDVSGLSKMMTNSCAIVSHYKHSPTTTALLQQVQRDNNVPKHKLKHNVATRWNSQVLMLERLLEQRKAVAMCLAQESGKSVLKICQRTSRPPQKIWSSPTTLSGRDCSYVVSKLPDDVDDHFSSRRAT